MISPVIEIIRNWPNFLVSTKICLPLYFLGIPELTNQVKPPIEKKSAMKQKIINFFASIFDTKRIDLKVLFIHFFLVKIFEIHPFFFLWPPLLGVRTPPLQFP